MAKPHLAILATLLAAVLWGTSFPVNDAGLEHVGPYAFAALRFLLAGAVALVGLALTRRLDTKLLRHKWLWGLALANGVAFLLQYIGQTQTTPARTALFVNSSAFAVAILERFLFREKLGPGRIAAIVVGVAGAALLIVGGDPEGLRGGQWMGDVLALASGLAWAVYFVMNKTAVRDEDPVAVTGWTFALTGIVLAPALVFEPRGFPTSGAAWAAIAYSGLVTTALAFALWAYGLRSIRASTSAVLLLLEILVASALSFAIGRESFGWLDLAGAALLVTALVATTVIAERESGSPASPGP